jgi:hypothetical protein
MMKVPQFGRPMVILLIAEERRINSWRQNRINHAAAGLTHNTTRVAVTFEER